MKKIRNYLLLSLLALGICSCGKEQETESSSITPTPEEQQEGNGASDGNTATDIDLTGLYLSITETTWDNGVNSSGGMTTTEYVYDLASGELYEAGSAAYTSQYPLAVYDKGDNVLYYSADDVNGSGGDALCCKVLDTGECYQLTDSLFAINFIVPTRDYVILIAVGFNERNLTPYLYEKATGELTRVQVYEDFSVQQCDYNPVTERLFLGGFLESEDYERVSSFNEYLLETNQSTEDVEFTPADGYVFELTDGYKIPQQVLYIKEQGIEKGVPSDSDGRLYLQLSYTSLMARIDPVTQSWILDTASGKPERSDYFDGLPLHISYYTKCGEDYYILGMSAEDDGFTYRRGIYRYRPGDQKPELIYLPKGHGFINQFRICRDIGKTDLLLKDEWKLETPDNAGSEAEADTVRKQIEDLSVTLPDENGLVETKLVPDTMQPGSCIYFVDDSHFVILSGGVYYDTEEKVEERKKQWLEQVERAEAKGATFLPDSRPEKGMYVDYGSDGHAHRIYRNLTLEDAQEKAK